MFYKRKFSLKGFILSKANLAYANLSSDKPEMNEELRWDLMDAFTDEALEKNAPALLIRCRCGCSMKWEWIVWTKCPNCNQILN
jgi:hypothetical protein